MNKTVEPASALKGIITLPPDKSISHRSALFSAIADGRSTIQNYSSAADPASTLSCLEQLGVSVVKEGDQVTIEGVGRYGFKTPDGPLDCGNSGTTMRLLTGIIVGAGVEAEVTGDESLSSRTMKRIIDPLRSMGASVSARNDEFAPILTGPHNGIKPIRYPLPIASAQLKSSVLLAGLYGKDPTEVIEQTPSRDHTERLLDLKNEAFGEGKIIRSSQSDVIPEQNYKVPGDFSAAAFWLVGASVHQDSSLVLRDVGMNPSRNGALHVLREMGADITTTDETMQGKEPAADLTVQSSVLKPVDLNPRLIPNCIDELPVLMVAMCFAGGRSDISGAEELRHKETDRLSAMYDILKSAGAKTQLRSDGITIWGDPEFVPEAATFDSCHDHRMAMAAAILASRSLSKSVVSNAECTAISYPGFWEDLKEVSKG